MYVCVGTTSVRAWWTHTHTITGNARFRDIRRDNRGSVDCRRRFRIIDYQLLPPTKSNLPRRSPTLPQPSFSRTFLELSRPRALVKKRAHVPLLSPFSSRRTFCPPTPRDFHRIPSFPQNAIKGK